ncbi:MAG: hypothetical protein Kow006_02410 [Gammaproteobacteria bacterium]
MLRGRRRTLALLAIGSFFGSLGIPWVPKAAAAVARGVKITGVRLDPPNPRAGQRVRITLHVVTTGEGRSSLPWLIQMDGKTLTSGIQRNHTLGRPFSAAANWNATAGRHRLTVRIDPGNTLRETRAALADNVRFLTINVQSVAPGSASRQASPEPAKVAVVDFRLDPPKPQAGQRSTLILRIATTGQGTLDVPWDILVNNQRLKSGTQRNVRAGSQFEIRDAWEATPGLHNFLAKVDPRNDLKENSQDLRNNARGFSLRVEAGEAELEADSRELRDLRLDEFSLTPRNPGAGERANFRLRIRGLRDREIRVRWQIYLGNRPYRTGSNLRLRPGSGEVVNVPWNATPGEHRFTAAIQPHAAGVEPNWNNGRNRRELRVTVTNQPPVNWPAWGGAALEGAIQGVNQWKQRATLTGVRINGPGATGGRLRGPSIASHISNAMKQAGAPDEIARKFSEAVQQAWQTWQHAASVPALPWYPGFAAWPAAKAPPTTNVPTPLASIASAGAPELAPPALVTRITARLGNAASQPGAQDAIHLFATRFGARFANWLATAQVEKVMGSGNVPSFAPPFVPVGPVVNGRGSARAGFLANSPF